jgi:hypothetical protein
MADNSLIRDLLKTPEQMRRERYETLRQGARAQAQLMGGGPATTALPGLLTGLAQQAMIQQAPMAEQMKQRGLLGLSSLAGVLPQTQTKTGSTTMIAGDGQEVTVPTSREVPTMAADLKRELAVASMSPEERVQAQTRGILQAGGTKKPEELIKLAEQLRAAGRYDLAETFETRAKSLADAAKDTARRKAIAERLGNSTNPRLRELAVLALDPNADVLDIMNQEQKIIDSESLDATPPTEMELQLVSAQISGDKNLTAKVDEMSTREGWFIDSVDEDVATNVQGAIAWRSRQILNSPGNKLTPQQAVEQATNELYEEYKQKEKKKEPKNNPALKKQNVDTEREEAVKGAAA